MTTNVKAFLTDVNRDGFHEVAEAIRAAGGKDAKDINYDNTASGLEADNVQDAIDDQTSGEQPFNDPPLTYTRWLNAKLISMLDMKYYLECLAKSTALYIVGDEYPDIIEFDLSF